VNKAAIAALIATATTGKGWSMTTVPMAVAELTRD
jgi:hypothetical protein